MYIYYYSTYQYFQSDNVSDNRNNRKQQKKWTGDELIRFIEMVEVREPIWNFKVDGYRNRNEKEKCWSEIAAATNHCIADCKAQFNAVRSRYNVNCYFFLMFCSHLQVLLYIEGGAQKNKYLQKWARWRYLCIQI